jgi:hypothetical protein
MGERADEQQKQEGKVGFHVGKNVFVINGGA